MKVSAALLLCLVAVLASLATASPYYYTRNETYAGQSVVRCPLTEELAQQLDSLSDEHGLDVWAVHADIKAVDLRIQHFQLHALQQVFDGQCQPFIADLEQRMRDWETQLRGSFRSGNWHTEYHRYGDIVNWYKSLASDHSLVTFVSSIGRSYEGRDQPAVVLTSPNGSNNKLKFYWQAQIHAREWISSATVMYVVEQFVQAFEKGEGDVVKFFENAELHIVLFTNPDGYEYTWSGDRLWRKNRAPNAGSRCLGTDLNRNYPDHWGQGGSSKDPCSETFMGPSAASAPEVINTSNYFKSIRPVIGAIDFHSYSQLLLRPYGWTRNQPPHEREHFAWGQDMQNAIRSTSGMTYQNIKSIELYTTTGSASDWFYGDDATNGNGGYRAASWTIELRDTGRYGFLLPPDQIIPTGQEIYAALRPLLPKILANPLRA